MGSERWNWFSTCGGADSACHAAYPDLREEFESLLGRLAAEPVTVSYSGPQSGNITYTPDYLAPVIRLMMKDASHIRGLPRLIHRAYQENDWGGFTQFILNEGNYEWWGLQVMERVIRCSEKWAAFYPEEVARLGEGSFLQGFDVELAQNQAIACRYTPSGVTPEDLDPQPGSQVPVLIFNGELDPIDPPENMAGAEMLWPNSVSLVLPYQAHSLSDWNAIQCLWSIEDEFVQMGSAEGLDTGCLDDIQPARFVTTR
jgi:pimeloyl-ACP methyl ester carboxylesterase